MSRVWFAASMGVLVAVAAWAYHVNYETAETLRRVAQLERAIAAEKERQAVLAVEWAGLQSPERLKALVAEFNDRLKLMPLAPDHFGEVAAVPYPPRPPLEARPAGQAAGAVRGLAEPAALRPGSGALR